MTFYQNTILLSIYHINKYIVLENYVFNSMLQDNFI